MNQFTYLLAILCQRLGDKTGKVGMYARAGTLAALGALSACAATQVQKNTVDMGDTIALIQRDQVLHNISSAINDRSFVPSGVVLSTGQANVSLGLTPTMKTTNLNMPMPAIELDVAPTDTWTAQWQFTSITNQDDLRRLRNLYALIVSTDQQYDQLENYYHTHPPPGRAAAPAPTGSRNLFRDLFEGLLPTEAAPPNPPPAPPAPPPATRTPSNAQIIPRQRARRYIVEGDSIDCKLYQSTKQVRSSGIPFKRWLYWRGSDGQWRPETPDPTQPMIDLGYHGNGTSVSLPCPALMIS